jgi:hypothetical protein
MSGPALCHNNDFQIFTDGPFGRRIASDGTVKPDLNSALEKVE